MKFGKKAAEEFGALRVTTGCSPFPYGVMKKMLKKSSEATSKDDIPARFFHRLQIETRRADRQWSFAARAVVLAARSPAPMAPLLQHTIVPGDNVALAEKAKALLAWANLAREALRKIVKKYNKQYGQRYLAGLASPRLILLLSRVRAPRCDSCGLVGIDSANDVAFLRSCLRTELEALANSQDELPSNGGDDIPSFLHCPVCLDWLQDPVGTAAGVKGLCPA